MASAAKAGGTKMIETLAPAFCTASTTVLSSGNNNNVVSAFNSDIREHVGSDLQYKTTGSAPNRILTVQYGPLGVMGAAGAAGTQIIRVDCPASGAAYAQNLFATGFARLNPTDDIVLAVYQDSAGAKTLITDGMPWTVSLSAEFVSTLV